jgi:ADP-heptose:LPS heptosyltransferase
MPATAKPLRYYLSRLLPRRQRYELVRRRCARRYESTLLTFPLEFERVRSVLLVLPESLLEALHQVENVMALIARFGSAHLTFLCRREVSDIYHAIAPRAAFVEYRADERYLYSPVLARYGESLEHEHFDVCILLERNPDLALLHIVGKTGAPARIGYVDAGGYPFLNHEVRPDASTRYLADSDTALARAIGAQVPGSTQLALPREAREDVTQLLRDLHVPESGRLAVVDALACQRAFGSTWTDGLLAALSALAGVTWCCPGAAAATEAANSGLRERGVLLTPPLSVTRTAALLERSVLAVSGNTPLFFLASLQQRPAVGLFEQAELPLYFRPARQRASVVYSHAPDSQSIASMAAAAQKLIAALTPDRAKVVPPAG